MTTDANADGIHNDRNEQTHAFFYGRTSFRLVVVV